MRSTEDASLEELWETSWQFYEQARRRRICFEWIAYHKRFAGVFRSYVDHHAREQDCYQRLLAEETEDTEDEEA